MSHNTPSTKKEGRLRDKQAAGALLCAVMLSMSSLLTPTLAQAAGKEAVETLSEGEKAQNVSDGSVTKTGETHAPAQAASFSSEDEYHRGRVLLGAEYFTLALGNGKRFSTTGIGVGGSFALTDKFGLYGDTMQTISPKDKDASLFTAFSVGGSYALTGRMLTKTTDISDGTQRLLRYREKDTGGFRLGIALSQYFFNAGSSSLSYSGFSTSVSYEIPIGEGYGVAIGAGAEHLSNGATLILPLRAFARLWMDL